MSRIPMHGLSLWFCFNYIFTVWPEWSFLYLFFGFHCWSVLNIARYFCIRTHLSFTLERPLDKFYGYACLVTLCFYPCVYEVLYWPTGMVFIFGGMFLSLSLMYRDHNLGVCLLWFTFLFSEMFILPALVFYLIPELINKVRLKELKAPFTRWTIACIMFMSIRYIGSEFVGSYRTLADLSPLSILENFDNLFSAVYTIHFYKVYPISLVFIGAWFYMNIILVKQKIIAIRSLLIIHFCLLISGGIYLIIIYSAIRAMYGASFVITSVLLWTLLNFYRSSLKRKIILFPLALIIFTFSLHQMLILSTKSANAKVIDTKIKELKKKMADCNEPCIIELGDLK